MNGWGRSYGYVGPADVRAGVRPGSDGCRIASVDEFGSWIGGRPAAELEEPFTFVVDLDGVLRLAPRRSEHVACAGGGSVRSAGEIAFAREEGGWSVTEVSNLSTGYCPDVTSWPTVAEALDRAGVRHPGGFTYEAVFRRCPGCQEHNLVREGYFVCVFCGSDLPVHWNIHPPVDEAVGLLKGELRVLADLGAEGVWRGFLRFAGRLFDVPDVPDADGLLFQYGTYSFGGPPAFTLDFVRQFVVVDEDGDHDHFVQVHCELRYGPVPALRALGSFDSWYFRDSGDDLGEWGEAMGEQAVWAAIRSLEPIEIRVYQEQV